MNVCLYAVHAFICGLLSNLLSFSPQSLARTILLLLSFSLHFNSLFNVKNSISELSFIFLLHFAFYYKLSLRITTFTFLQHSKPIHLHSEIYESSRIRFSVRSIRTTTSSLLLESWLCKSLFWLKFSFISIQAIVKCNVPCLEGFVCCFFFFFFFIFLVQRSIVVYKHIWIRLSAMKSEILWSYTVCIWSYSVWLLLLFQVICLCNENNLKSGSFSYGKYG